MQAQTIQQIPLFNSSQEAAVGIEEYIANGKQIPAITKYLLSDFIVNQIDISGNVVVLQTKPLSVKFQRQQKKVNYQMTKQLFELISNNLSLQAAKQIQSLYEKLQCGQRVEWQYIMQNISKQKTERTKMHNFVRQKLQNIQSNTLDGNKIRLKFNKKLRKVDPASRHKYTYFKLFKSNIDTMSALFKLSKITGISQKVFSSAGLKDKRGITTQLISLYNSDINFLKRFYEQADRNRQIWIDGFEENKDDAISMGCLYGNQFGLILRLLNSNDASQLQQRIKQIKQHGIINYFGMQRFGSCATKTHLIGVHIVKKQWKQLVQQLLLQDTGIPNVNKLKKQMYENKQYNKADRALSNKFKIQKSLFQGLSRHGNNYYNVFQNLPRSMKTLYCHALQSYLWNKITSKRIRQYGNKLIVGDIVGVRKEKIQNTEEQQKVQCQEKPQQQRNRMSQKQNQEQINQGIQVEDNVQDEQVQIALITDQNIQNYSFFDLVAPLYGNSISLPQQSIMNKYLLEQLMKLDLHKDDFEEKSKSLCFKGAYRKCIVKPPKIECEIVSHKQKRAQILSPFYMKQEKVPFEQGDLKSAKIILQLPKSSYATIAIRQILHIPSSFKVQTQLNHLYDKL